MNHDQAWDKLNGTAWGQALRTVCAVCSALFRKNLSKWEALIFGVRGTRQASVTSLY